MLPLVNIYIKQIAEINVNDMNNSRQTANNLFLLLHKIYLLTRIKTNIVTAIECHLLRLMINFYKIEEFFPA